VSALARRSTLTIDRHAFPFFSFFFSSASGFTARQRRMAYMHTCRRTRGHNVRVWRACGEGAGEPIVTTSR